MLKEVVTEWTRAFEGRKEVSKFVGANNTTRRQCVFSFRDVEVTTNEIWSKHNVITNMRIYVPSTGKFINPKCIDTHINMHWTTIAGIFRGLAVGTADEEKFKLHRTLWLEHLLKEVCDTATERLKETKRYKSEEIKLVLDIIKHHVRSDNLYVAYLIMDIFVEYCDVIMGHYSITRAYGGTNIYIDKFYSLLVSVLNRRFISKGVNTISIKDCNYLFKRVLDAPTVPPIYKHLREVVSYIHDQCEMSSNFMYVVDALCAYYATITCVPQDIKLAEIQQREHAAKLRKERQTTISKSSEFGTIGDAPVASILDKLSLKK